MSWLRLTLVSLLTFLTFEQCSAQSSQWPRFRGVNANGVAPDNTNLPTTWSTTEHVNWVADVPGSGWSGPVVWDDKVFLTSVISDEGNTKPEKGLYLGQGVREPEKGIHHWMVYCFDINTGDQIWKQESHAGLPVVPRHPKSSYGAETPTTTGTAPARAITLRAISVASLWVNFGASPIIPRIVSPSTSLSR